jgi:hypothetical protein
MGGFWAAGAVLEFLGHRQAQRDGHDAALDAVRGKALVVQVLTAAAAGASAGRHLPMISAIRPTRLPQ